MNRSLEEKYTLVLDKIIQKQVEVKANTIFVFTGITPYIKLENYTEYVTDLSTFDKEGNDMLFGKEWFGTVFTKLTIAQGFQIISHQQFAYLNEYLSEDFFKERVLVVYDNLRSLFLLSKENYIEHRDEYTNEERPEGLPIYQAEQLKINENYFYTLKNFSDNFERRPFFTLKQELELANSQDEVEVLDVISNPYAIDGFVNQCILEDNFGKQVFVKVSGKNVLNKAIHTTLQEMNHLLGEFGGGVYILHEESIQQNYIPKAETLALLKQYWGPTAEFRDILIYENPEISSNVIPVSQGLIVDTIIDEYQKGCRGVVPRDIFITAPTGAGKSLIFQLPAFHAASNGDVTIVVSPLKALMTDQVDILHNQRHYNRVEFLNSDLTLIDRDKIIESCKKGDIDILYLSPELLLSYDIHYFLGERKLGLLIVDEAHLITTWGRDFRVDYWFLGNHINKIRKYNNYMFPLVALTATAVYGGINDMVFDSINSLNMHDPHKFIGNVRRKNIEFVIDTHDEYAGGYDKNKEIETINFVKGIKELGMKGIVYAPYTKHINRLKDKADEIDSDMVVAYHGGMIKDQQQFSYQAFKSNQRKIMIATKAFGMGVDIPDIQVVYHHAPSGLLPDYIQEIGRAARKDEIQGYAALTFSKTDLRYSKQLFGISSLKTFQLQAVLRKIIRYFNNNGKKRNMLMSANDFAYIFDTDEDVDQKVATALMMIEKDYLIKSRFNVLIARPKKLFTKVYARTTDIGIDRLKELYGDCFTEINKSKYNYHTIELNLDSIWSKYFSDKSFPQLKSDFYKQQFLSEHNIELVPQIKVTLNIEQSYLYVLSELSSVLKSVSETFAELAYRNKFFTQDEFVNELKFRLNSEYNAEKIASFVLSTYSGYKVSAIALEGDSFLQNRRHGGKMQYQVFSTNYEAKTTQLLNIFSKLYEGHDRQTVNRYLSINDIPLKNHIRLGSLLELMNLGTFETKGGDDPKIFLRLNDPRRIEFDSNSKTYENYILESVKNRHKVSCQLFEHFFTHYFNNENRWDMIEDFFLGMSNDEILEKYPGKMINHVDIIDYLKRNAKIAESKEIEIKESSKIHSNVFAPRKNQSYFSDNMLTIGSLTMPIRTWLVEDPISLHRTIEEYNLRLESKDFKVLLNKLRLKHFSYYRDFMGLQLLIEFPGYQGLVTASVPYKEYPTKFYKWWRQNQDKIKLSHSETIKLFLAVDAENPKALLKEHRQKIGL